MRDWVARPGSARCDLGELRVDDLPISVVRAKAVVAQAHPQLFSGRLRDELTRIRRTRSPTRRSSKRPIWLPARTSSRPPLTASTARSRNAAGPSGGQRQRLVPARAPRCWIRDSAARRADERRRRAHRGAHHHPPRPARAGRTTVITSASPLVLAAADEVVLVEHGWRPPVDRTPRCWVRTRHTGRSSREGRTSEAAARTAHRPHPSTPAGCLLGDGAAQRNRGGQASPSSPCRRPVLARGGGTDRTDRSMGGRSPVDEITGARRIERVNQLLIVPSSVCWRRRSHVVRASCGLRPLPKRFSPRCARTSWRAPCASPLGRRARRHW